MQCCYMGKEPRPPKMRSPFSFDEPQVRRSSKNSHKCMAAYTLEITRPYSSSKSFELLAWDDEWGRPLNFRVERFSNDGSHVLILLIEGNYPQ